MDDAAPDRPAQPPATAERIGVVIVTFNSADVIIPCLESLFASTGAALSVVVVDNNSDDGTADLIERWATVEGVSDLSAGFPFAAAPAPKPVVLEAAAPGLAVATAPLTLIRSPVNGGFAHACNVALRPLLARPDIDAFWCLNPDCVVPPDAARRYLAAARERPYALLGSRTLYYERPDMIQSDGGRISPITAVCSSINTGRNPDTTPLPAEDALDYISGANMVASRAFIDQAGMMPENYFLYYEEVDWAQQRGDLPLRLIPGLSVYHIGGTSIGSGSHDRRASAFSEYFNARNRIRFARRHMPTRLPFVVARSLAKAAKLTATGDRAEGMAELRGALGLPPSARIAARIKDPAARAMAFDKGR